MSVPRVTTEVVEYTVDTRQGRFADRAGEQIVDVDVRHQRSSFGRGKKIVDMPVQVL